MEGMFMEIRVLTLPFSSTLGAFDESGLSQLQDTHQVTSCREACFTVSGQPFLACVVECHARDGAAQAGARACSAPTKTKPQEGTRTRTPQQDAAFERIRAWRKARAEAEGVPPYVLLTNRELGGIIDRMPENKTTLGSIEGIGAAKLRRYGDDLLALIAERPIDEAQGSQPSPPATTPASDEASP